MSESDSSRTPGRADYRQALQSMDTYIDITIDDLMELADRARDIAARRVTEALSVQRVMTRPVATVHPQTTLSEAAHLMVSRGISGLPVTDDRERLVGIITEADFLRALGVPAHQPHHTLWQTLESLFNHLAHHAELEAPDDAVAEHMVREVITIAPERHIQEVIELMKRHRVKRVVVCNETQQVLGMITRSDLVRVFFDRYTNGSASDTGAMQSD
ncbi:MAG: CBS domain-containing protein [Thiogranum sp.]|nr:CBS domain-containing protein [Thiogranum sp.]